MLDKNSIYGFSPEQNAPFQDFIEDIEFEKAASGSNPLDSSEGLRVIVSELKKELNSEKLPATNEASLIIIGLTYRMLSANKAINDDLAIAFQQAAANDPLAAYEERQAYIKTMKAQLKDQ